MSETPQPPRPSRARARLLAALATVAVVAIGVGLRLRQAPEVPVAGPHRLGLRSGQLQLLLVDSDGHPVAGGLVNASAGNAFRAQAAADPTGHVRFTDCPDSPLEVSIDHAGFVRTVLSAQPGPRTVRVVLPPGARIAGTVQDETGKALPGARVRASPGNAAGAETIPIASETITNDTGAFAFDTLPPGMIDLDVSLEIHQRSVVRNVAAPATQSVTVVLPRTAAIAGRTLDKAGAAIAGATVTLAGSGVWPNAKVQSDSLGGFRFEPIPEGVYELRAEHAGQVSAPVEGLAVDPGGLVQVDLQLAPGVLLTGRVYDAQTGGAIAGASVQLQEEALSAPTRGTQTAADGGFSLGGLRAVTQRVAARAQGYVAFDGWVRPGGPALPLALLRAGSISGQVLDDDGEPVPDANVVVRGTSITGTNVDLSASSAWAPRDANASNSQQATGGENLGVMHGGIPAIPLAGPVTPDARASAEADTQAAAFRSDAKGQFQLNGVPPGALRLCASHAGFATSAPVAVRLGSGEQSSGVELRLTRGGVLEGELQDPNGQPIPHVRVQLLVDRDGSQRSALSARDGSFRFDALVGNVQVTAFPYGLPPVRSAAQVEARGTAKVVLVLDSETKTLRGRVLDDRGRAIESASVNVRALAASTSFALTVLSAPDGTFEAPGLPPPPYNVSVDQPQYAAGKPLRVTSVEHELEIRLQAGGTLQGAVLDGDANAALQGARITLTAGWLSVPRTARSDSDGLFEFQHLSDGTYTLSVDASGFISQSRNALVSGGARAEDRPPEAFVLVPAGSVSGDVVDRRGVPVWNAEVAATEPRGWAHATRTDHAGHFVLTNLPPGDTSLRARHAQAGETAASAPTRVFTRQETPGVVLRLPELVDAPEAQRDSATGPANADGRSPALSVRNRAGAVVVDAVVDGSPAARAGLQAGDLLLTVDAEVVRSAAQARGMLQLGAGTAHSLEVRRTGTLRRLRYAP